MDILYKVVLIITLCLARIGMGAFQSLFGPTLLYLAANVDTSVTNISIISTGKSLGRLFGSILGGVLKNVVGPSSEHLLLHGVAFFVLGTLYLSIPWITDAWLLLVNNIIAGIFYGYLSASMQAFVLQISGMKSSPTQIQLFHLMYTIGAFIAPLIAGPFLSESDKTESAKESCPNSTINISVLTTSSPNINATSISPVTFDQTGWSYIIVACYLIFVSFLLAVVSISKLTDRVEASIRDGGYSSQHREEEPIRNIFWFFIFVIGYYSLAVSTSGLFETYIYAIALCSQLNFSIYQATQITSIFRIGNGIGRLSGVIAANFFKPKNIVIFGLSGSISIMVLMSSLGHDVPWLSWMVSVVLGYTTSLLYPAGISWVSEITNISGKYMFVPEIGNSIGNLALTPLGGYIFDVDSFAVVYLILGVSICNAVMFAFAYCSGYRHLANAMNRTRRVSDDINSPSTYGTFIGEISTQRNEEMS